MKIDWHDIEYGGAKAEHDAGDETGAILTIAKVVQGGNGLWTPCVLQYAKGRPRKKGRGRVAGKCVSHYWPGQVQTREKAIQLCEQWLADLDGHVCYPCQP